MTNEERVLIDLLEYEMTNEERVLMSETIEELNPYYFSSWRGRKFICEP